MNSLSASLLALVGTLAAPIVPAQTCNPHIRPSAPDNRYVVNTQNSTVLDKRTGLTWKRCIEGTFGDHCGTGFPEYLNWSGALSRATASTFAGYKDWRLPNSKELESLVEVACYRPALNAAVFPYDPSYLVWAASPTAFGANFACYVSFDKGYACGNSGGSSHNLGAVRLVRGGQ